MDRLGRCGDAQATPRRSRIEAGPEAPPEVSPGLRYAEQDRSLAGIRNLGWNGSDYVTKSPIRHCGARLADRAPLRGS